MPLFGRRRSQSLADEHLAGEQQLPQQQQQQELAEHPPSGSHSSDSNHSIFHGIFRRRSDSSLNLDSSRRKSRDESRRSGDSTLGTLGAPESAMHPEPKQPGNIQDYLEYRLDMASKPKENADDCPASENILTKKEIKAMFSGAPHFLLERGKHKRWYPQVIFPWDEHNPSIQRMLDRKPLSHPAFTLCTLHAHLPVPDDWRVRGGVPTPIEDWGKSDAYKRATFDVGIFEVPNMLGNNGREPGTVGFRHFLEFPLADAKCYTGPKEPQEAPDLKRVSSLPATEAFDLMVNYDKPYSQCLSGAVYDRRQLIRDGPNAWKRIGVRDINIRSLIKRLEYLRQIRLGILRDGSAVTLLDYESAHEQHNILHSQFLYPRPPLADVMPAHPQSLKSQIKTLTTVLATPGAWVDFSVPEWRFRAGQLLWETPPHGDGQFINLNECNGATSRTSKGSWINDGMERKWLLVQLLLAAELLFRLDAFVRIGMLHDPQGDHMTAQEMYHFDKLREGKVNWDLIVVRRFLDNLEIAGPSPSPSPSPSPTATPPNQESSATSPIKSRGFSLFQSLGRHISSSTEPSDLKSAWDCHISSPHTRQQLEGLYNFAENIGWPDIDALRSTFEKKLQNKDHLFLTRPNTNARKEYSSREPLATRLTKNEMYSYSASRRCVQLHSTCAEDGDIHDQEPLGWISRSWLSGFVIPGESICHILIGTLLENDTKAVQQLGTKANLYGGFAYAGRSWWSKACIVGRVLSSLEGASTSMGWVGANILPRDATTLETFEEGWFEVTVKEAFERSGKPRIKQGGKLAAESTPLGIGDITADAFTLPTDLPTPATSTVSLGALTLSVSTLIKRGITTSDDTSLSFTLHGEEKGGHKASTAVSFPLKHNVRFISAHACRPPLGFASRQQQQKQQHGHLLEEGAAADNGQEPYSPWGKYIRLPGHPLHRSFVYKHVPLDALPNHKGPQGAGSNTDTDTSSTDKEVLVIDARGDRTKETFVRAWCASIGSHALIGRAGRTCVACCVREAKAVDVQVVVRVGE